MWIGCSVVGNEGLWYVSSVACCGASVRYGCAVFFGTYPRFLSSLGVHDALPFLCLLTCLPPWSCIIHSSSATSSPSS